MVLIVIHRAPRVNTGTMVPGSALIPLATSVAIGALIRVAHVVYATRIVVALIGLIAGIASVTRIPNASA